MTNRDDKRLIRNWIIGTMGFIVLIVCFFMFALPPWRVWQQRLDGDAELARAESARQVQVAQARAEKEAASLRAEAIAIVGRAAQEYPEYRQQEFIGAFAEALKEGNIHQILYVPTEANIPVTEAGRIAGTTMP